jgi:hypothetical protein
MVFHRANMELLVAILRSQALRLLEAEVAEAVLTEGVVVLKMVYLAALEVVVLVSQVMPLQAVRLLL